MAPRALEIDITSEGDGGGSTGNGLPSGGHGLIGMRERTALHAGELRAGPTGTGGYEVHATLTYDSG